MKDVAIVVRHQMTDGSRAFNIELKDSTSGETIATIGMDNGHAASRLADEINKQASWIESGRVS